MEPEAYRVSEFCKKYAISRTSLYREIAAQRLQPFKRGSRTFITRTEADKWFACLIQNQLKPTKHSEVI